MNDDFFVSHTEKLEQWAQAARQRGWLDDSALQLLEEVEGRRGSTLFAPDLSLRPLVVAFFGGTGVGKSSLINRLAGGQIAETGIERPTSKEATLYLHDDFRPEKLPAGLPLQQTRVRKHRRESQRLAAWLDLPDMDSTATGNRALVDLWLPHIDWLVYVVSPERYRDDAGWRYLRQRARRHSWLFVMNHWDTGSPEQVDDFRQQLQEAGFPNPLLLRTSCAAGAADDDFSQLERLVYGLIHQHGLETLQNLGIPARLDDLLQTTDRLRARLGQEETWQQAAADWRTSLRRRVEKKQLALEAAALNAARELFPPGTGLARLLPLPVSSGAPAADAPIANRTAALANALRAAAGGQENDTLAADLRHVLHRHGLATASFTGELAAAEKEGALLIDSALKDAVSRALLRPGSPLRRSSYRLARGLVWLLPLAAACWAVSLAVLGFVAASRGEQSFFGFEFVSHAGMLVLLAWLVPALVAFRLRPDPATAVTGAIGHGLEAGGRLLEERFLLVWQQKNDERQQILAALDTLEKQIRRSRQEVTEHPDELLGRLTGGTPSPADRQHWRGAAPKRLGLLLLFFLLFPHSGLQTVQAAEQQVTLLSTQFREHDESALLRREVLAGLIPKTDFQPHDYDGLNHLLAAGRPSEAVVVCSLAGDLAGLADRGLLADLKNIDPAGTAPFLERGYLRRADGRELPAVPWVSGTYLFVAHRKALPYLPAGADLEKLTYAQLLDWAANLRLRTGKARFGLPAGSGGLLHRFIQGFLYPSYTGSMTRSFRSEQARHMWRSFQHLWRQTTPWSLSYNQMAGPLLSGEVWLGWDHSARLHELFLENPGDFIAFPAPVGPVGRGHLSLPVGLAIAGAKAGSGPAAELLNALTRPGVENAVFRHTGFLPLHDGPAETGPQTGLGTLLAAARQQASAANSLPAMLPEGLGTRSRAFDIIYLRLFSGIVLQQQPLSPLLDQQAERLRMLLEADPAHCGPADGNADGRCLVD